MIKLIKLANPTKLPPHILWPGIVISLLLMSLTMVSVTVTLAVRDPSFAVEADYYERGLRWDEHRAQLANNQRLGWAADVQVGAPDPLEQRPLAVTLRDANGQPISAAEVTAAIFHHARAHRVEELTLEPTQQPGLYAAPASIRQQGRWTVSLTVEADGEHFTDERTLNLEW